MRYRRYAYVFSLSVIACGLISMALRHGFKEGVDFAGGILVEYRFNQHIDTDRLRDDLSKGGFGDAEIQASEGGETFLIRVPSPEERIAGQKPPSQRILEAVQQGTPGITGELLREEVVGPRVGRELRGKAFWAVLFALLAILIWVGIRYEFKFALGGVISIAHDVLVVLSFLSIFNKEITIPIIAALLTIAGYSINDTIVVFDRIRERLRGSNRTADANLFDLAVNQTLSRTIMTSLTVFLTVEALWFLGGSVIHDFAFAMLIGVGFGTYSSVYVASALALDITMWSEKRKAAAQAQTARVKA
jgi:preprotein translocase SecF subunit